MGNVEKILVAVIMTTIVVILALAIYGLGTDPGYMPTDEGQAEAAGPADTPPFPDGNTEKEIPRVLSHEDTGIQPMVGEATGTEDFLKALELGSAGGPEGIEETSSPIETVSTNIAENVPINPPKVEARPASTWAALPASPIEGMKLYEVKAGDSLSTIAHRFYRSGSAWRLIEAYNKDIDPNKLRVGSQLLLPSPGTSLPETVVPAAPPRDPADGRIYQVKKGDTLYGIARKFYQDEKAWKSIYDENRHMMASPADLKPGMNLKIPQ